MRSMTLLVALVGIAAVGLATLVIWAIPSLLTRRPSVSGFERHESMSFVRSSLLVMFGGLGALASIVYTARGYRLNQVAHLIGRFQDASRLMADTDPTARLGGIHTMAQLADDWPKHRQHCIDVLCAYVRNVRPETRDQSGQRQAIEIIARRLQPETASEEAWHGYDFDLRNASFDTADFSRVHLSSGSMLLDDASVSGHFDFSNTVIDGASVSFRRFNFEEGSEASFDGAHFESGSVSFGNAAFSGKATSFGGATFGDAEVSFENVELGRGGTVSFSEATFKGRGVSFDGATFSEPREAGGRPPPIDFTGVNIFTTLSFEEASIRRRLCFDGATITGAGSIDLTGVKAITEPLSFAGRGGLDERLRCEDPWTSWLEFATSVSGASSSGGS